jgi:DNA-binding NarL/FixJ family response regulator
MSSDRIGRHPPDEAAALWGALLHGRWTIVAHVDSDGRRFVLAQRNEATQPASDLSNRERQIARLAAMGLSGKIIACELGVAPSTVSTTLKALLGRLNLNNRFELASAVKGWATGR